ncbi:hypothetical protein B0J18DRAFT_430940 [Chaetomium sp. MPI-SDFR-AT-0129]|nr:hypothetical protein B0J18DRAFT_430940 [Chaetomium sp. MPI-SDFR-AT-0129]
MACPPVRLVRPKAFQIDATTPCVLEINIPIPLPSRFDPSLPAPPYILDDRNDKDDGGDNDNDNDNDNKNDKDNDSGAEDLPITPEIFRDIHAGPFVGYLLPQIATHLFGSAVSDADISDANPNHLGHLLFSWDGSITKNNQDDFDFAGRRWWRDQFGVVHRGTVHAYNEFNDDIRVLHAFCFYLVRGVADAAALRASNPRVLSLREVEGDVDGCRGRLVQGEEGGVTFEVKEYDETWRGTYVIPIVAWLMEEVEKSRAFGAWGPTTSGAPGTSRLVTPSSQKPAYTIEEQPR